LDLAAPANTGKSAPLPGTPASAKHSPPSTSGKPKATAHTFARDSRGVRAPVDGDQAA
jgi:hypothetical protein